jgi:hypothetical protein
LVLSLTIMALMLVVIITLVSFLKIESQLATNAVTRTRSRMQAMLSLRLALAHLQQEAGPDRRTTARADICADTMQPGWDWNTIRNPLWTGVWRTDKPAQPPAWLVSGRHDRAAGAQSVSLSGAVAYDATFQLPWDGSYAPLGLNVVTLVGDASASPAELPSGTTFGKPDGRIALPRVALPDPGIAGTYAYWIGDEGVKARINLNDPRLNPPTGAATDQTKQDALRGTARPGLEIMKGLETMPAGGIDARVRSMQELPLLTLATGTGLVETSPPTIVRRLYTESTLWSRGVLCDTRFGGLKVDLSLAFELTDAAWNSSEFSNGAPPKASDNLGQLTGVTYLFHPDDQSDRRAYGDNKVNVPYDGANHWLSTVYAFAINGSTGELARGPTWDALRNYYRLYKEVEWTSPTTPTLRARTHFPNTISLAASGYGGTAHYSHRYNRMDSGENYLVKDFFNGKEAPRPVKVSVTPYVSRQLLVWGLMEDGDLRLTLSPITVLHNPYNVAVRLSKEANTTDTAAMRLSFRAWDNWTVNFSTTSKGAWSRRMIDLARTTDGSANWGESFRTYIKDGTVLQPGEFRVFSSSSNGPLPFTRLPALSTNSFDFLGGFYIPWTDPSGNRVSRLPTDNISVGIQSTGPFYVRHLLTCWPGDRIMDTGNANDGQLYNVCSEVTELLANDLDRSGIVPAKTFLSTATIARPGQPPTILAAFDYGLRWPRDPLPFPVFTHSNPMATMTRPEATGIGPSSMPAGYAKTSSSFKLVVRSPGTWPEVLEAAGAGSALAYGGLSISSGLNGQTSAVYTEVPLAPPISLAQFTHANFTIRDQEPLFAIGSSYASLYNPLNAMGDYNYGVTTWDQTWMINAALFDRYFLSGAAPEIVRGAKVTEKRDLAAVLDDFVAGRAPLANPRITLFSNRDSTTVRAMVGNHRRIAGATLNEGAFNVNSTSVEAWASLLASAKRNAMGAATETQPAPDQNARYPRAVRADKAGYNYRSPITAANAWTGLNTLDDDQIRLLAKSIVAEIRTRVFLPHRSLFTSINHSATESYTIPLPFIGLAQFVNRYLCGYHYDTSLAGCLQTAIVRADVDGANLSNRTINPAPTASTALLAANGLPGSVPWTPPDPIVQSALTAQDPRTPGTNRGHLLAGAPTSLLQADLLAVIGPALTTRSDTFVIRCYGDVTTNAGSITPKAGCWIEAVVQRSPEFCDPTQPPETEVCDPTESYRFNPQLKMVNRLLGRRFQVISLRYLSPKEL